MSEKLFTSCNLCSIPFLGHTDTTRLQMSSKQLVQSLTNTSCEIPKVIGSNFRYLTSGSTLFKLVAPVDGQISYTNDEIMIVMYNTKPKETIESYDVIPIRSCSSLYATKLRYKREIGQFKSGDILYEYDSFKNGIPTYGYNIWTSYMPFFGYNHEDAMVVSESVINKCRSTKSETIIIPIYAYSLFKQIYQDSPYGFIPDIGQKIDNNILTYRSSPKTSKNITHLLKSMNLSDFSSALNNELQFNSTPITSRIKNGTIVDIKVHAANRIPLIDKRIQSSVEDMYQRYYDKFSDVFNQIYYQHGKDFANHIIMKHYVLLANSLNRLKYNIKDLSYLIEVKIAGENHSHFGDKMANRYAHKGVISLILPDELRPIAVKSKKPIDILIGPISVVSRMNFGQVIEGNIAKVVSRAEDEILKQPSSAAENLMKLSVLANSLGDPEYSQSISNLSNKIKSDSIIHEQFIASVRDLGLYFEGQNFANFNEHELHKNIESLFGITVNEPVLLKRDLLVFIKDKMGVDIELPKNDITLDNIYCAPIYTLKLKQEAEGKLSSRDFGNYKATNRQPVQGKNKNGNIGQSSRLGHMEFDGLFAHHCPRTISELRTVKNDNRNLKSELIQQILTTGNYNLPNTSTGSASYTKLIIDSLIDFINS